MNIKDMAMRTKDADRERTRGLLRLALTPAVPKETEAARLVAKNRRLIRKAMRMGHGLEVIARELRLPKRTLQRYLSEAGLFFRKPRKRVGHAVKRNLAAISRAKMTHLANV